MSDTRYKISIARFPGDGWERHELTTWLVQTAVTMSRDPRISHRITVSYPGDTPITMVRNRAVKEALDHGFDYLLMLDSDMVPDLPGEQPFWPTAWQFMLERREAEEKLAITFPPEVVSAKYPPATICAPYGGPPPHENVYVFEWKGFQNDHPDPAYKLDMFTREQAALRTGIEEVAALPTGLILYDLRVFRILPQPWFAYEHDHEVTKKVTTEDVYQTRNASLLGLPQYVAWDCWAGHLKTKVVGRPQLITRDQVHKSLIEGLRRDMGNGERIRFMGEKPWREARSDQAAAAPAAAVDPEEPADGSD